MESRQAKGISRLLGANASFAFADVYISLLAIGAAATFWHSSTAAIVMLLIMLVLKKKFVFSEVMALAPIGLFRVLVFSSLYAAYQYGKVGVVFTIVSCSSLVAVGIFAPLQGEKLNLKILGLLSVAILGLLLVSRGDPRLFEFQFRLGEFFAVLAMFGFAYCIVLVRKSAVKVEPFTNVTYMFCWLAVGSFPFLVFLDFVGVTEMRYWLDSKEFLYLFIILLGGICGHVLYVAAQKFTTLKMTGISLPAGAVFTSLLAMPVKNEYLDVWQWFGIAIVATTIVMAAYIEANEKDIVLKVEN